jgi:hypothetical protein
MCTVTFIPRRGGYVLGMNRDEQLTRALALPPIRKRIQGRDVVFPAEPSGGTWIGLNDAGACLALINWYSAPGRVKTRSVSRGDVLRSVLAADAPVFVDEALAEQALQRVNPFRLIGVFPGSRKVAEWTWDLKRLTRREHAWKSGVWISSGFDEWGAQRTRGRVFAGALRRERSDTLAWLRRLHRSHEPERGPYAICMHREDAATVSYTEVVVSRGVGTLSYLPGPPCGRAPVSRHRLNLRKGEPARAIRHDHEEWVKRGKYHGGR